MGRRRFLIGLLMLAVIAGAASFVGYLYIAARDDLLTRADGNLRQIAHDAATEAYGLFEPAQLVTRQIVDARLDRETPADAERRFFGIARTTLTLAPQVTGVTLARNDGSVLLIQNLPARQLVDAHVLAEAYKGFVRRVKDWDGVVAGDVLSYWDPGSRDWVETAVSPAPYDARTRAWYEEARQREQPVWSKPYVFSASGAVGITLAMPVHDASGALWGVIGVDFALSRLSALILEYRRREIGEDGFMFIGSAEGQMLGHSRLLPALRDLRQDSIDAIARASSIQNTHLQKGDDLALFNAIRADDRVYRTRNGDRDVIGIRLPLDPALGLATYIYIGEPVDGIIGNALADLRRNIVILILLTAVLLVVVFYAEQLRREVGERKRTQAALSLARDAAETATRAKSSFLAMMSHEIRTPMNGVMSMVDILNHTELSDDQRSMTRVIWQSSDALLTIINDILDFSKIEAGKLDLEHIEFDLVDAIESVGDLLAPRAEEKRLTLLVEVSADTPRNLIGDPNRIRQVLLNLCGNALKFTSQGFVQVTVSGRRDQDTWGCRVEVADTGIGLSAGQQAKLFQPFVQADTSTSRKFGGTGLGLSICQRLCSMMGGAIGVESTPMAGSTFWFEVPLTIKDASPHLPPVSIGEARVLLVQYEHREATILERYLQVGGVASIQYAPKPDTDADLRAALERVEAPIDLVIVNARGGAKAVSSILAELRRHPATGGSRDVLVAPHLAASIIRADGDVLADAQWLATVTTPIRLQRLWSVVGAALGKVDLARMAMNGVGQDIEYVPPELATAAAAQAVVLVAEDNATNRYVVKQLLGRLGYAVEFAEDGAEALQTLERQPDRYGILLTDFHMPVMDGFELTHAIRELEAGHGLSRLPIVALTADVSPETEAQCLEAGMDGYLRKPIERPALVAALERWLPQALPLKQPKQPRLATLVPPSAAAPPVDHAVITSQIGTSDMADHIDVLQSFWESCGNGPDELQSALSLGDAKAAREVAHSLKGATAMIGATQLSDALKEVEFAARDGELDRAGARTGDIRSGFRDIRVYLDTLAPVS